MFDQLIVRPFAEVVLITSGQVTVSIMSTAVQCLSVDEVVAVVIHHLVVASLPGMVRRQTFNTLLGADLRSVVGRAVDLGVILHRVIPIVGHRLVVTVPRQRAASAYVM